MTRTTARVLGGLLIAAAALGVVLALAGITLVWWSSGRIDRRVESALETTGRTLAATDDLLAAADDTLERVGTQTVAIEATVADLAVALEDTAGTARTFGRIAAVDAATAISETQVALQSVSQTARLVDDSLRVVSALPGVGSRRYQPDVGLATSIGRVAESLEPIPSQLGQVDRELSRAATNIESIRSDVDVVAEQLGGAEASIDTARASISAYQDTVAYLERATATLQTDFSRYHRVVNVFLTLFLLWLVVAQIGLLTQGLEWWSFESVDQAT
jgi:septal ring factor EnvC (AmiA/AmiB activator)